MKNNPKERYEPSPEKSNQIKSNVSHKLNIFLYFVI